VTIHGWCDDTLPQHLRFAPDDALIASPHVKIVNEALINSPASAANVIAVAA
jgi:hypothetical protein